MDINKIFRVKDSCSLDYPNGECWARRGEFVFIDWDNPQYRTWMHGQASRVRNLTPDERTEGGEVVPIDPKFEGRVPGYTVEQDRMFRLDQPRSRVVTKGARRKAKPPEPDPIAETESEPEGDSPALFPEETTKGF